MPDNSRCRRIVHARGRSPVVRRVTQRSQSKLARGFPPIARADAKVLILGSLPSQASLAAGRYYAHPRNAFWPIAAALFAAHGDYSARCSALMDAGVAVWDVLAASERPGSLDADIREGTARANDFDSFFAAHDRIRRIGFNGRKAEALFRRLVRPQLKQEPPQTVLLPSTSPAHATLTVDEKLAAWRRLLAD